MNKNKYKNRTKEKSIQGGVLVPFHKEGNTTYFKVFANNPLKTDSVLIGPNNKNGIALDNNEIVKETKKGIEVASDDLGTVNLIENLSNRMPLSKAFTQGFVKQEAYKNANSITSNSKMNFGGEEDIYAPVIMSNGRQVDMEQTNNSGESYYDIVKARYNANREQLAKRGYKGKDLDRLAKIMTYQNNLEGGWVLNRDDNNWGGMRENNAHVKFDSLDSYYDTWFNMMNEKWPGWDKAKDYIDFANIINHDDLGLKGEEEIKAYQKEYRKSNNGKEIYWYAPHYENNNKHYRDHLGKVYERTNYYINILDKERKPEEELDHDSAVINRAKQLAESVNNKQYSLPFDRIMIGNQQSNQQSNRQSHFTGGRIRMVNGGDKKSEEDIKADIEPAVVIAEKPNTRDRFYIRKRKIGNKTYYDVNGKLIDNEVNAYRYATSLLNARGTVDMSDTLDASNISSNRKKMPFDSINFTVPVDDKLKDGRKWTIDSLKLNSSLKEETKHRYYPKSTYEDNPNLKEETKKDKYVVSRYEDNPFIKESTFVGPVLKTPITDNTDEEPIVTNKKSVKSPIKSTKNTQSGLRSIDKNLLTSDYTLADIAPSKEIEDITLNNTLAKRVGQEILNGNEYLSSIDALNPIKRQAQSPVKIGTYAIGKSGPSFGDKVKLGWNKFKNAIKSPEGMLTASAVTDAAGNIISNAITQKAINSTNYVSAPIQNQAYKLKTDYNINPQLDSLANATANAHKIIDENTSSSKTRQNRLNMLRLNSTLNANQLYANKENAETQLINEDIKNQQNISNSNIDTYNKWLAAKTEFDNNKILSKAQSTANMISGIGQAVGNLTTGLAQANQFNKNMELLKTLSPDAANLVFGSRYGGKFNKKKK